ncbi:hypothetical protein BKA70DRAFT_1237011 [Coprinopsis sp. MPI-PUGE-AT-0042]|nr:hypothetical protein BKA70DRAFT_1237011 [Coprinopsis sp. MPI-PUGE-AT-0042]
MQFKSASLFVLASIVAGAIAGQNCKCQASNGQGPQYNTATEYCCRGRGGSVEFGTVATCVPPFAGFMGPNNQASRVAKPRVLPALSAGTKQRMVPAKQMLGS